MPRMTETERQAPTQPAPPPCKVCSACLRDFTLAEWLSLAAIGMQDDGEGGAYELRNCRCGSTLAMEGT
jgi:hypothetical protein